MISSLSEVKAYLGITSSSEDSFLQSLLDSTEAGILAYLGYTTLSTVNITAERHKPTYTKDPVTGVAYYLDEINPHGTVTINAVAPTKFEITGSRLFVLDWSGSLDDFGKVSIGYEAGYATIPADIKLAQNLIVADKRGKRKAGGIAEFSQGDLRVKYATSITSMSGETEAESLEPSTLLNPYKKVRICS